MFTHPAFYALTRLHARAELRRQGYGFSKINEILQGAEDGVVDAAVLQSGTKAPEAAPDAVGAFGDGTIIQAIIDFLKSPQGQLIIAALVKLLITALGGL